MLNIPVANIEKETVRLEQKCKQMREWKGSNSVIFASFNYAVKVYNALLTELQWFLIQVQKSFQQNG